MYFWISAFDHRAIVVPKMHIVHCTVTPLVSNACQRSVCRNNPGISKDTHECSAQAVEFGGVLVAWYILVYMMVLKCAGGRLALAVINIKEGRGVLDP